MKVVETTLKIFLTSGITVTVKESEKISIGSGLIVGLKDLAKEIKFCIENKVNLSLYAELKNEYQDEKGKTKIQDIKHHYFIPYDRISWYIIEEV